MRKHRLSFVGLAGLFLLHGTASAGDLVDAPQPPDRSPTLVLQFGHTDLVRSVAFSPDGKQVLTGSDDRTVRMWDSGSGREIRAFRHLGRVTSVAFSPDGKRVLARSERGGRVAARGLGDAGENAVLLWDADSGQEMRAFRHPQGAQSVAFSPDGKQVLTASHERPKLLAGRQGVVSSNILVKGVARLWDVASGKEIRTFRGHDALISALAFSPDGTQVLTGSLDETARLWDAQSGQELRSFSGHSNRVMSVAFSPDGKRVLTGTTDDQTKRGLPGTTQSRGTTKASLWDVASGREIQTFSARLNDVESAAFSPDGKRVLLGGQGITQMWDVASGKVIRAFPEGAQSAALSPDGKHVLTGNGPVARLWAVESTGIRSTLDGHTAMVSSMAFSPDGTRVLTGSWDTTARLWDAASRKEIRAFPHPGFVYSVAFSRDGKQVLTGSGAPPGQRTQRVFSGDPNNLQQMYAQSLQSQRSQPGFGRDPANAAWLWDAASGKLIKTFQAQALVRSVAFSPDGRQVLTGDEHAALLWNAARGKVIRTFQGIEGIEAMAFSPDGKQVLIANSRGRTGPMVQLWDAARGRVNRSFLGHSSTGVKSVAFSPDGKQVLTGCLDGTAHLWNAASGEELRTLQGHTKRLFSVAFSADGKQVLTASDDITARWWDAASGKEIRALRGKDSPWSVAFSPDGKQVIAASGARVRLLNAAADENELRDELRTFAGLARPVRAVAFSPDARRVFTISANQGEKLQVVHVWDAAAVKVISSFSLAGQEGTSVAFSPNGQYLVVVSTVSPLTTFPRPGRPWAQEPSSVGHEIRLLDPESGKEIPAFLSAKPITYVAFAPDGRHVVTVTTVDEDASTLVSGRPTAWKKRGDTARLWDVSSGKEIRTFDLTVMEEGPPTKMLVHSVSFSGDGARVLMVGLPGPRGPGDRRPGGRRGNDFSNDRVGVWDVASGERIKTAFRPEVRRPFVKNGVVMNTLRAADAIGFSPDGRQVLTSAGDGTARLWDLATGEEVRKFAGHEELIFSLCFSPDGKQVLTRGGTRARLWDVASGQEVNKIDGHLITFSPDSKQLFTTGEGVDSEAPESGKPDSASTKLDTPLLWHAGPGKEIHALKGHTDAVMCMAFSPDGKHLLTGSADGTARIWQTASGQEVGRLLAFADGTWAAATSDNNYTASKGALKGVAFRVGKQVFAFDQFDLKFNRPDKVLASFGLASEELIAAYRHAYQKRLKRMNFTEQMLGDDFHLPTVTLLNELPLATRQQSIAFKVRAHDDRYLLDRLSVYVNGVPPDSAAGISLRDKKTSNCELPIEIELSRGPNTIEMSAINEKGAESLRESVQIDYTAPAARPDLYVVVVGISAYQDSRYRLTYADKDANDLAYYFQSRKANFNQVRLVRLVNQDATRDNILKAKHLLRESKVDDQVIVFFAGHGLLDDTLDYYFATVDLDFSKPSAKGLSYEAIEDLLDGIPARKKLLLMDTCHSGEVDKEEMATAVAERLMEGEVKGRAVRGLVRKKPLGLKNSLRVQQELFAELRRSSGAVVISAAGGMEFALESADWKNGVFTYAVLRGLKDRQADRNKDNRIQVSELRDYIMDEVRRRTRDQQSPTVRMENLEFDYALD